MIFRRFLAVAQELVKELDEASWRSAVSRAYYAAFHVGRDLLRQLGFSGPRADASHAFVWRRLSNAGHPKVMAAGRDLNNLRSERNRADYQDKPTFPQRFAMDLVRDAGEIIAVLDGALLEPTRRHITEAIKKYERDVLKEVTWRA